MDLDLRSAAPKTLKGSRRTIDMALALGAGPPVAVRLRPRRRGMKAHQKLIREDELPGSRLLLYANAAPRRRSSRGARLDTARVSTISPSPTISLC